MQPRNCAVTQAEHATPSVRLIGAGGHARVVFDALRATGMDMTHVIVRDGGGGPTLLGQPVLTPEVDFDGGGGQFHVAIGAADVRARLTQVSVDLGGTPFTIVHPRASVSVFARLGEGSFVAALAVIGPQARIGRATIVNHGAVVDHDVFVGDFCHVAPNATLGGGVRLGNNVLVGSGSVVLPGVVIGDDVTIGAGAVVLADIADGDGTWVGNPARKLVG